MLFRLNEVYLDAQLDIPLVSGDTLTTSFC